MCFGAEAGDQLAKPVWYLWHRKRTLAGHILQPAWALGPHAQAVGMLGKEAMQKVPEAPPRQLQWSGTSEKTKMQSRLNHEKDSSKDCATIFGLRLAIPETGKRNAVPIIYFSYFHYNGILLDIASIEQPAESLVIKLCSCCRLSVHMLQSGLCWPDTPPAPCIPQAAGVFPFTVG